MLIFINLDNLFGFRDLACSINFAFFVNFAFFIDFSCSINFAFFIDFACFMDFDDFAGFIIFIISFISTDYILALIRIFKLINFLTLIINGYKSCLFYS